MYSLILNEDGIVIDDAVVLRLGVDLWILTVPGPDYPAVFGRPDFVELRQPTPWIADRLRPAVDVRVSGLTTICIQGPLSRDVMSKLAPVAGMQWFDVRSAVVADCPTVCLRTGCSGELGFELLVWPEAAHAVWETVVATASEHSGRAFGVEATMMLGLEKGLLNRHDLSGVASPECVGLGWAVDWDNKGFVGREALMARMRAPAREVLVGVELAPGEPCPSSGATVWNRAEVVGRVTNAAYSPILGRAIARAVVDSERSEVGSTIEIVSGTQRAIGSIAPSFRWYDPKNTRVRL
jgi:glycine cleavage system aminomethyltransferase T